MVALPEKANKVTVVSALLAALAVLMLAWQIVRSLRVMELSTTLAEENALFRALLLVAVIVSGVILAMLWAVVHNTRVCQRAQERLEWMAHRLPGAFYVFRLPSGGKGTYEFLTVDAGNVLGVSREEIVSDASVAYRLVVPEDRERMNAELAKSRDTLTRVEADFRIQRPDGEIRWVRTLAVPVPGSNNDVVWNGHLFDITEIRLTEQALRDATQRLEYAQSVAHLGDWACDFATGEVTCSPQMYELLGRKRALGPPSLAEVVELPLEGPQPMADAFEQAQATGETQSFEASTLRPDGSVVTLEVIVLPVFDATGNVTGMRGTMQDISARKAMEERLTLAKEAADATNQAKSAFLATMSHEIRTPLNGMLGLLELISLTPIDREIRNALEAARDSGHALQRITDDILDFSKVEAGKLEIFPEPSRLQDLVDSLQRTYAGSAKSLGLALNMHVDPDIRPVLMLDALRLRQILSNLISNAIKFTPKGSVELRVRSDGSDSQLECLRFEVIDTGIGISSEDQTLLFQDFEQAHSIANRFGGTGLGLSISRRLAELMGGHVSMSSKPGVGTTMTLHMVALVSNTALAPQVSELRPMDNNGLSHQAFNTNPAALPPETFSEGQAPAYGVGVLNDSKALILVVDDHPTNRMVLRQQMNALGYRAEDVGSGAEALEKLRTDRFSLVLSDLNMPGMSGYDLTRQVREIEAAKEGHRIPIIACSANAIAGVMQECMIAGMDDYIPKPINLRMLSEKLSQWLPVHLQSSQVSTSSQHEPVEFAIEGSDPGHEPGVPTIRPGNERAITQRARAHFREVNDADVMQLMEAIQMSDMEAITHMAHRIKGACGFINATGLASVSGMIEQAGRAKDAAGIAWLIDVFNLELEQLNATLDS